jgi:hypothetical protein
VRKSVSVTNIFCQPKEQAEKEVVLLIETVRLPRIKKDTGGKKYAD